MASAAAGLLLLVTLDTNQIDEVSVADIRAVIDVPYQLAVVSVTKREGGTFVVALLDSLEQFPETGVWGESCWDEAVWGGSVAETLVLGESPLPAVLGGAHVDLEDLLRVISNGSFPPLGKRDVLTGGQRNQLRDAMILQAHSRDRRHVLISNDDKAFRKNGRRERLEALCQTRIMNRAEFNSFAQDGLLRSLLD